MSFLGSIVRWLWGFEGWLTLETLVFEPWLDSGPGSLAIFLDLVFFLNCDFFCFLCVVLDVADRALIISNLSKIELIEKIFIKRPSGCEKQNCPKLNFCSPMQVALNVNHSQNNDL